MAKTRATQESVRGARSKASSSEDNGPSVTCKVCGICLYNTPSGCNSDFGHSEHWCRDKSECDARRKVDVPEGEVQEMLQGVHVDEMIDEASKVYAYSMDGVHRPCEHRTDINPAKIMKLIHGALPSDWNIHWTTAPEGAAVSACWPSKEGCTEKDECTRCESCKLTKYLMARGLSLEVATYLVDGMCDMLARLMCRVTMTLLEGSPEDSSEDIASQAKPLHSANPSPCQPYSTPPPLHSSTLPHPHPHPPLHSPTLPSSHLPIQPNHTATPLHLVGSCCNSALPHSKRPRRVCGR